jgi:hypothetical protein
MRRFGILCAACAALGLSGGGAAAQSFRETLNLVLLGSTKDKAGLVEIQNASDCVVKLSSGMTPHYAVLRLNNVDPRTVAVSGKPGEKFLSFGGPDVVIELHDPAIGLTAASGRVQLTAGHPQRERQNFDRLYSRFCSGWRPPRDGVAGS